MEAGGCLQSWLAGLWSWQGLACIPLLSTAITRPLGSLPAPPPAPSPCPIKPQMVPNFSLKSLVASWAERHRIADLSTFSADVGRQRTLARIPAEQLAALHLSGSSPDGSPQQNKVSPGRRERLYPMLSILREGSEDGAAAAPAGPPPPARPAAGAVVAAAAAAAAEARAPASSRGVYPSMQPGTSPPASRKEQAEVALAALRGAASPGGGSGGGDRGAAPYHAWTLMQLAADADGRRLLWEVRAA